MMDSTRDVYLICDVEIDLGHGDGEELSLRLSRWMQFPFVPQNGMNVVLPHSTHLTSPTLEPLVNVMNVIQIDAVVFDSEHGVLVCESCPIITGAMVTGPENAPVPQGIDLGIGPLAEKSLTDFFVLNGWDLVEINRFRRRLVGEQYWHVIYPN